MVEEPVRTMQECLELRLYFDQTPQDGEVEDIALTLKRHINNSKSGSLCRVSFGRLYSIAHHYVQKWRQHAHERSSSSTSKIIGGHSSQDISLGSSQQRTFSTVYRATIETNDIREGQVEQLGIFYHAKMLLYSICAAILPGYRTGTISLV